MTVSFGVDVDQSPEQEVAVVDLVLHPDCLGVVHGVNEAEDESEHFDTPVVLCHMGGGLMKVEHRTIPSVSFGHCITFPRVCQIVVLS